LIDELLKTKEMNLHVRPLCIFLLLCVASTACASLCVGIQGML